MPKDSSAWERLWIWRSAPPLRRAGWPCLRELRGAWRDHLRLVWRSRISASRGSVPSTILRQAEGHGERRGHCLSRRVV